MTEVLDKTNSLHRIVVGISGGVDSSVAALLLKQQGFAVEGVFMKNWEEDDDTGYCTDLNDLADAEEVCGQLGIPLHRVNFAAEYWDQVFAKCLEEFRSGRTPNPDILCNKEIKFKRFLDYALDELDADAIATGHYARLKRNFDQVRLLKGHDLNKDQSYFLHRVSEQRLAKALFPLGEMTKDEVRTIALDAGFKVHDKPDSTGICFIGERPFSDFLKRYIAVDPGDITDPEGHILGRHDGLMYYTIGQRQGLCVGGVSGREDAPWYVAGKDFNYNRLIVVQGNDHDLLFSSQIKVGQLHWINSPSPSLPCQIHAKCRYRQSDQACVLKEAAGEHYIEFEEPQRAVTPGQSVCFYSGDCCLGGGIIL